VNIGKIVLPIDGPNPSLDLVHQAAGLARHFGAEIVVVGRDLANASTSPILDGIAVRHVSIIGDPARAILHVAHDEGASLIAIAPHEFEPFYESHLSSVAATVLYESECPVWTSAHQKEAPKAPLAIRHVLCAVDFSPNDRLAMEQAAQIAAAFGALLTLVHITPSVEMYGPGGTHESPSLQRALHESATRRIIELRQERGVEAETLIASGDVPEALSRVVRESQADLTVIGSRRSAGAWRTNAYGIVCRSRGPVLSV